jgi:N-acetylglucosaminyldiphosphoundecaprenol N-acetyl-beta-D-mannosaminyltransferase
MTVSIMENEMRPRGTAKDPRNGGGTGSGAPYASRSAKILGVRVDDVTNRETLELLESFIRSGGKHQVATVNPEFIMEAQRNPAFLRTLNATSLSFPDGIGVIHASRIYGVPFRERVAGVDIVERFAAIAAGKGYTLFFLGAAPGVADQAADILRSRHPGLAIVGTYGGTPSPDEEEEIRGRINAVRPDVLLVAYGAPRQDLWISRNLGNLNVSVAIGIGGTFDFITGKSVRAPLWMRGIGLEWFHRLVREPRRWKRMLALPRFAVRCAVDRIRQNAALR